MQLIRGIYSLKQKIKSCAIAVGNFDGVHTGHQHLLSQLKNTAQKLGVPAVVMTFEPQPGEFFARSKAPARLTNFREKCVLLQRHGVDTIIFVRFNAKFAGISAQEFVQDILCGQLGMQAIIVGDDFRFGAKRSGDFALLQKLSQQYHFHVVQVPAYQVQQQRVSSTLVRQLLQQSDFPMVQYLLGRPFTLSGRVAHGDKRGRELGFPTANIRLRRYAIPLLGIFVVHVHGVANHPWPGVASIGTRPVFDGQQVLLEVHLLDFDRDIYGVRVEVEILHKLRNEEDFKSVKDLVEQIKKDVNEAWEYFRNNKLLL